MHPKPTNSPVRRRRKKSPVADRSNTPSRLACSPYLVKLLAPGSVKKSRPSKRETADQNPIIRIRPLTSIDESLLPHHDNVALESMRHSLSVYFRATKHIWYSVQHLKQVYEDNKQILAKEKSDIKNRNLENIENILKAKREALLSRLKQEVDAFEEEEDRYTNKFLKRNENIFDEEFKQYNRRKLEIQRQQEQQQQKQLGNQYRKNSNLFGKNVGSLVNTIDHNGNYTSENSNRYAVPSKLIFESEEDEKINEKEGVQFDDADDNCNNDNRLHNQHAIPLEAEDDYIDRGKIIHAAVQITSQNHAPMDKYSYDTLKMGDGTAQQLEDWNEEENENALTMIIVEHTERLLKLWSLLSKSNKNNAIRNVNISGEDINIPVRIQFLAHAAARRRVVKAVKIIFKWWCQMKSKNLPK
jgi:hypothetical protein